MAPWASPLPVPPPKALAPGRGGDSRRGGGERPRPASRGEDALGLSSESGLSDESSSPEWGAFSVGFERNQLNQPNPDLLALTFASASFPVRAGLRADFPSASSEDSSLASLTDPGQLSEQLCALGDSGSCGVEMTSRPSGCWKVSGDAVFSQGLSVSATCPPRPVLQQPVVPPC